MNLVSVTWLTLSSYCRYRYAGSVLLNFFATLLPALYETLSKLWIARIDSSKVALTDTYTQISNIAEVANDGLPEAAWTVIGDNSSRSFLARLSLAHTLIVSQSIAGLIISVMLALLAPRFISVFVPASIRASSLTYVRITAFSALSSTLETSVTYSTRALDMPTVPFILNSSKFIINIILDFIFISRFHIHTVKPTVNTQALIRLACDMSSALIGLAYFLSITSLHRQPSLDRNAALPSLHSLKILLRPGLFTFTESAVRNVITLWLLHGIASVDLDYATAWRKEVGIDNLRPQASRKQILQIIRPILYSLTLVLVVEVPISIFFTLFGCEPFAYYLSGSQNVAKITAHMWRTIDWCFFFFVSAVQLSNIWLATRPSWFLYQSLAQQLLYTLPWTVNAWSYHGKLYGGQLIVLFFVNLLLTVLWYRKLRAGSLKLSVFRMTKY
ncbi:hypothetical protein EV356DRAFT_547726 [Viridothelium virens]|uniref:Uncharacterized protein n=1 Tax=Viridothelium virens TaxID=1048519 RepID=A0A6A6H736_VIRVR|nr:hypothetical protein EV356DRAFT_547726 [Viridothelium virens]